MAKKVQLQTNGKEWQVIDGEQVLVDAEKQDIDPITSSSCVQLEGFRTLEEAVSDNKMLSQDLTYTKVMDKVGGDYHQNVLDGQYSKAILYGNTQVNLCEEDSSNALQIPTTFTSFNSGELQIKNKESQVVAPLIKGVTMVNLAQTNSSSVASGKGVPIQNVKGNTVYTLSFTFTTKNTNSGVVIECYDVNGEYLGNVMHKTGLGDVAKFTFTTHANATKIHICNNEAYGGETIQLDDIMLIEGDQTALDIPFFKGMKSVELVRPLTNLFTDDLVMVSLYTGTGTNSNGTVTSISTNVQAWAGLAFSFTTLKPNTKYLVMWDSLSTTQTSTSNTEVLIGIYHHDGDTKTTRLGTINASPLCPTIRSIVFDTGNYDVTQISLRIHATLTNTETGTTTVTGLRVFEYDDYLRSVDLQSIGWFSGTKNVAVEPVKTCSKNLYPCGDISYTSHLTNVDVWFDAKGTSQMHGDVAQKSRARFLLKKGTYTITTGVWVNVAACQIVDDKEQIIVKLDSGKRNHTFTLLQDTYCTLRFKVIELEVWANIKNIQIERGETATDYVAHDSRYYEPDGQNAIVLRSLPSGVCDTFNLQTGEYIQRIGETVLDGSSDETWYYLQSGQNGLGYFRVVMQDMFIENDQDKIPTYFINDKYNIVHYNRLFLDKDVPNSILISSTFSTSALVQCIFIYHNSIGDMASLKTWLSQNPITVQYQLANPITTIIPRTIKRNNNGTVSTVDFKTYTNKESLALPKNPSYLTINSMTSIKPVVEPITYIDFKTRLKANTDYTIKLNKETNAFVTTNLGGTSVVFNTGDTQKFVKTPSIDLEQNLRISGSGTIQNIMVIEGDVLDKELPYFNGMCNVKMPIVRNCGRNLCNSNEIVVANAWKSDTQIGDNRVISVCKIEKGGGFGAKVRIKVKPNTTYYIGWEGKNSSYVYIYYNSDVWGNNGSKVVNRNTTFTTLPNTDYITIGLNYISNGESVGYTIITYNLILVEANNDTNYIPYRGNDICIAQGEIKLSQDMFEQGGISYPELSDNMVIRTYEQCKGNSSARLRSKTVFKINGGKTYKLTLNDSSKRFQWYLWGQDGKNLGITGGWSSANNTFTVTVPQEAAYMSLMFRKQDDSAITVDELNLDYLQLLELDSTVQLRSLPNGVKDELNLLTGEYIQRVGEVVLDGSEDWGVNNTATTTTNRFILTYGIENSGVGSANYTNQSQCDKLKVVAWDEATPLGITIVENKIFIYNNSIEYNVTSLRQYLQQNPITVQYELAEPIISYPRIVSNTQEREVGVKLPNGICDTYNPSTGITVKRVGKVVLDGSEDWILDTTKTNTQVFELRMVDITTETANNLVCDKLPISDGSLSDTEKVATSSIVSSIYIALLKTKASTVDELKTYLASNPITVYYELVNPIVTTDIVLPNGVHDEYNPLTGLYTKRVGYIELDGSDDEQLDSVINNHKKENTIVFFAYKHTPLAKKYEDRSKGYPIYTNQFEYVDVDLGQSSGGGVSMDIEGAYMAFDGNVCFAISKEKLKPFGFTDDMNTTTQVAPIVSKYLSQNPLKAWYELETPITYQLTPYFGLPQPYAYKDGYLIMDSAYDGQTLPPEITYQLTVNRTGQITQNNIKLKEHTARLSNLEYMLIEATLDSIFSREMQNFELELMNIKLINLDE